MDNAKKYSQFEIPKSGGGIRKIKAPCPELKLLQSQLSRLLHDCFDELYGPQKFRKSLSHGFRRSHSIVTNANTHRGQRYVFNIDLKDFFPSLNFGRVRGFFLTSKDFELEEAVATTLAQIACYENELPQGSPSSPVISNLIGNILDIRLVRMAKKAGCTYSRYADDITFSTRDKKFPALIAVQDSTANWVPSVELTGSIKRAGFEINENKISMQYWTNRQSVTGLVVNKKANIPANYYRQARAMCDSLFRTGSFYIGKEIRWGQPKDSDTPVIGSVNQLRGVLSYIYNVKKMHDDRKIQDKWENPTAIHELMRRFLYFEKFHTLSKPLIFCEGKTDNVYLKCALKSLNAHFPKLISLSGPDTSWHLDFFKHSDRNLELMQFSGGTGDFPSFIHHYKARMARYLCPGRKAPVILLIDQDSGAKEVFKKASQITGKKVDGHAEFYHLVENLYLVTIPLLKGSKETMIEDLFFKPVTSKKIEGKKFNPDTKTFDRNTEYGKQIFAEKVVKAGQSTINFSRFRKLLKRIEAAIIDFDTKVGSAGTSP